jgi:hypothetical protein
MANEAPKESPSSEKAFKQLQNFVTLPKFADLENFSKYKLYYHLDFGTSPRTLKYAPSGVTKIQAGAFEVVIEPKVISITKNGKKTNFVVITSILKPNTLPIHKFANLPLYSSKLAKLNSKRSLKIEWNGYF